MTVHLKLTGWYPRDEAITGGDVISLSEWRNVIAACTGDRNNEVQSLIS
jgi:hypothetical protein